MEPRLNFLVHSATDGRVISERVGFPEYSYYFVLKDFLPVLERLGTVRVVADPAEEVDVLFDSFAARGERALFLNFTAPHNMAATFRCPTVHVFAWEFDTLPTESWCEDGLQDWRAALRVHRAAITHSEYAKAAITDAMGPRFPVAAVPCPVWDNFDVERRTADTRSSVKSTMLFFEGRVFDTRQIEFFVDMNVHSARGGKSLIEADKPAPPALQHRSQLRRVLQDLTPPLLWRALQRVRGGGQEAADDTYATDFNTDDVASEAAASLAASGIAKQTNAIALEGVVYTSIFNPLDGRKNWRDMISAFVWAHKKNADATLVLKTPNLDAKDFIDPLTDFLKRFLPFDCRIVVVKAFLDDKKYKELLNATTYYVNTSFGEGQCLPLMEYLSAGVPALAPDTTALADYMKAGMSFVIPSHAEPSTWQHDPRLSYRALRYRVDWLKLVDAFVESRALAVADEEAWRRMGAAAAVRMKSHCSREAAEIGLRAFLDSADLFNRGGCGRAG